MMTRKEALKTTMRTLEGQSPLSHMFTFIFTISLYNGLSSMMTGYHQCYWVLTVHSLSMVKMTNFPLSSDLHTLDHLLQLRFNSQLSLRLSQHHCTALSQSVEFHVDPEVLSNTAGPSLLLCLRWSPCAQCD